MNLPKLTQGTVNSLVRDLRHGDDELDQTKMVSEMSKNNPVLLEAILRLSEGDRIASYLYICELISRQKESDDLDAHWADEVD